MDYKTLWRFATSKTLRIKERGRSSIIKIDRKENAWIKANDELVSFSRMEKEKRFRGEK